MNNICVIPARGGSKRIPRKNIRTFHGKPMIAWSIDAAKSAGCFDRIVVSTDDPDIASFTTKTGTEVVERPAKLADDHATTVAVVQHFIDTEVTGDLAEIAICCLYATAPFVRAEDIRTGAAMMASAAYAFTVSPYAFPIQRAVRNTDENRVTMFDPTKYAMRSQDLEEAWHDAGQFYWGTPQGWANTPLFESAAPIPLPRWRVVDIDTEEDWIRAELMAEVLQSRKGL